MSGIELCFPLTVGLVDSTKATPSQAVTQEILKVLQEFQDQQRRTLLLIYPGGSERLRTAIDAITDAGIACRSFGNDSLGPGDGVSGLYGTETLELVEAVDVMILLRASDLTGPHDGGIDILSYARSVGRLIVEIDANSGARRGTTSCDGLKEEWLPSVFAAAGVSIQDDLATIRSRVAPLARSAAKVTRQWRIWLLLIQGLAVVLPLTWLTKRWTGIGLTHALAILLCVAVMVAITWWLRWRGRQKIWARTRLVAEVGRSMLATQGLSSVPAFRVLNVVPALRPLRWCKFPPFEPLSDFAEWRRWYGEKRLDEQFQFFVQRQERLEKQRANLTRWATLLLDVSLSFAAAGFVTVLYHKLSASFGGIGLEAILGAAGIASVLSVILVQTFAAVEDLNRLIAICARQREMITGAKRKLESVRSPELTTQVVEDTEGQFLQEVLDWYFTVEHSQPFYSMRRSQKAERAERPLTASLRAGSPWLETALARFGSAIAFILRVLLGRVPWIVGSAAFVSLWLGLHLSNSGLGEFAKFVDASSRDWTDTYDAEKAKHGCVVIVHGLWGEGPDSADATGAPNWTTQMARAIEKRLMPEPPTVLILDWHLAATPSRFHGWDSPLDPTAALHDFGRIRPQAYKLGNLAGTALGGWIHDKNIDKNQPLHLIGHSAGGYVVTRCALLLKKMSAAPSRLRVTILDTPAQLANVPGIGQIANDLLKGFGPLLRDDELLKELPQAFPGAVDFYVTSDLPGLPKDVSEAGLHTYWPPHQSEGRIHDHQYAWKWYIETIEKSGNGEGFDRSPLLNKN